MKENLGNMRPPRLSTFPLHKPFEKQDPRTTLSEVGLRLITNFYSDSAEVVGTAAVLCGNLLITAKHVLEKILPRDKRPIDERSIEIDTPLYAVQILASPEPQYVIWDVCTITLCPVSDIALLSLATNPGMSHPNRVHQWRTPPINPFPPEVGERVAAFGYRKPVLQVSKNAAGGIHIDVNDEPMVSVGVVKEIYEMNRDGVVMPFPCYQVSARFDGNMSGGPVFDETGCLCGIVCTNFEGSHVDDEPISYVTTLWPLFRLILSTDRGDAYPRGVRYPAIDLARGGQIHVPDLTRLESWFSERIDSSNLSALCGG
jgi:Trypsin-like peptidase domain